MSVARRAGSGAASAGSYWSLRKRVQYATRRRWAAAATRRRWAAAAAARASRFCWAAEATRRRWAGAARANRNNAMSSGPIITRAAKRSIAATTRTTAIPIAINISYNIIRSPPSLAVGTEPLAYFLKFHFSNARTKPDRHNQRDGSKLKPNGSLLSRTLNTLTLCRVPDTRENLWARVRQGLAARAPFLGPANLFLTLASSAAPKFQSQETSREQSGDTRQPL